MVENKTSGSDDFVISRTFDAPRELVWRAFTEPERLMQWWGPRVMTTPICEIDLRPGGKYRIVMRGPDNVDYPMIGVYTEILQPERIAYTVDTSEHPPEWHAKLRAGLPPGFERPVGQFLNTITFDDLGGGQTQVTVRMSFDDVAIRDALLKLGMSSGWAGSLERLAELLAKK